jgi:hypothetical protein
MMRSARRCANEAAQPPFSHDRHCCGRDGFEGLAKGAKSTSELPNLIESHRAACQAFSKAIDVEPKLVPCMIDSASYEVRHGREFCEQRIAAPVPDTLSDRPACFRSRPRRQDHGSNSAVLAMVSVAS